MPSFQDSAVLVLLALLLFGPKGLAKLARQLGKLMGEFRRASNDFRMQMEDEFRLEEQAEQQKKIAAMEAAAPVSPVFAPDTPGSAIPEAGHPHQPAEISYTSPAAGPIAEPAAEPAAEPVAETAPLPIATSGDLHLMPPSTGLPQARSGASSLASLLDSIPRTPDPEVPHVPAAAPESSVHG
jgi:sec-independent protein translocase protein TatB